MFETLNHVFSTEQHLAKLRPKYSMLTVFCTWHGIGIMGIQVKKADNHTRSIILALGVCVALAIALTLWTSIRDKSAAADNHRENVGIPTVSSLITKSLSIVVHALNEGRGQSATR
jgi:Na+-translocating ferredoxin:NAD+ oxidoreductase RnfA subunit